MEIHEKNQKLITPPNFTIEEYLNYGERSVVIISDRELILKDWECLSVEEKQKCLSILFAMQPVRVEMGFNFYITCGYRTYDHELRKGRSGDSKHLEFAIDITCDTEKELEKLAAFLTKTWVGGFKYYKKKKFIHVDLGPNRRW